MIRFLWRLWRIHQRGAGSLWRRMASRYREPHWQPEPRIPWQGFRVTQPLARGRRWLLEWQPIHSLLTAPFSWATFRALLEPPRRWVTDETGAVTDRLRPERGGRTADRNAITPYQQYVTECLPYGTYNAAWFPGATKEAQITSCIAAVGADPGGFACWMNSSMIPFNATLVTFNNSILMLCEGGDRTGRDIQAYGADPTGVVAADPSIQAALNGVPATGGRVVARPGTYLLAAGLTSNTANLEFVAYGALGSELAGQYGATTIKVPSGVVGFTFNPVGSSTNFEGPTIRGIDFRGLAGALGGVRILRTNNFCLDRMGAADFTGTNAYGVFLDGTGNFDQYGIIKDCEINHNFFGIKQFSCSGNRIVNNHIDGGQNAPIGSSPSGTIGIWSQAGGNACSTTIIHGNILQGHDILVQLDSGENDTLVGNRYENFITAAMKLTAGDRTIGVQFIGGSINNFMNGSIGTGIVIGAGVDQTLIIIRDSASPATISDAGTNTIYLFNQILNLGTGSQLQWDANTFVQRLSSGNWKFTNNVYVNGALVGDAAAAGGAAVYCGGALDSFLLRPAGGGIAANKRLGDGAVALTWGATVSPNAALGNYQTITATSNIAATVAIPTNLLPVNYSQPLIFEIFNNSGGALTTPVAFATGGGGYLASGGVSPANGFTIIVEFRWNQPRNRWVEVARGAAV